MANDIVGQTIYFLVCAYRKNSDLSPLDILDKVCTPFSGCAVDFCADDCDVENECEWLTDPRTELGRLMVMAFSPEEDYGGLHMGADALIEKWWEEVYEPFRRRYSFRYLPYHRFGLC